MTKFHDLHFLNGEFQPDVSLSSFTFIKGPFSSFSLFAIRVVSSAYLRLLIFLLEIFIPVCASSSWAFLMMYSAYKLSNQGDNIQPWHTPFLIWNQSAVPRSVLAVASWCAYRFLRRQIRWYGIPISVSFPQFVVIHTVKAFCKVDEAEVGVFLQFSCFFYDPEDVGNLISGSSAFSKSSLNISISQFMYCWRLAQRNYFGSMWDECNCVGDEHSFKSPFFWIGMNTSFPVLWPLLSFPNLLAYWMQQFSSIIF